MNQSWRLAALGVGLAALFGACASMPTGDARSAIEAANRQFASGVAQGSGRALAALYTANAQVFPPNADIVSGREAIERLWQSFIAAGVKGVTLTTLEVEAAGDTAYEVGKYAVNGDGGNVLDTGKYVVVWKLDRGQWRLHRDIWNTSAQPAR
jgi:ketosteroid isomerase-like protein